MEITGIIIQKLGESSGTSAKTGMPWRNAEFLMEIPGEYKRHINFKVRDGQYNLIARFEALIGKTATVSFNIEAHEATGRWFNEVRAWGVLEYKPEQLTVEQSMASAQLGTQRTEGQTSQTAPTGQPAQLFNPVEEPHPFEEFKEHGTGDDDLPF